MDDTHFVTPNGLDADGHYSTAADMALLARYAMKNETVPQVRDTKQYTLDDRRASSRCSSRTPTSCCSEYNWVTGIKTGCTPNGGPVPGRRRAPRTAGRSSRGLGQPGQRRLLRRERGTAAVRAGPVPPGDLMDKGVRRWPRPRCPTRRTASSSWSPTARWRPSCAGRRGHHHRGRPRPALDAARQGRGGVRPGGGQAPASKEVGRVNLVATKSFDERHPGLQDRLLLASPVRLACC